MEGLFCGNGWMLGGRVDWYVWDCCGIGVGGVSIVGQGLAGFCEVVIVVDGASVDFSIVLGNLCNHSP